MAANRRMNATWIALLALLVAATSVAAQTAPSDPNLTYAVVGGRALRLDVYRPAPGSVTPTPLVVFVHGGAWSSGSRAPLPSWLAPLLDAGVAVASVDYRLTSEVGLYGAEPVTFPAQIHDVKAAIRWLRAHAADYDFDSTRIALWGSSAGAHLAAIAGLAADEPALEGSVGGNLGHSSEVAAVVDYAAPTDLVNFVPDTTIPPFTLQNHDDADQPTSATAVLIGFDDPDQGIGVLRANATNPAPPFPLYVALARTANPVTWVSPDDPPFFIAHGTADNLVPLAQSRRLRDALLSAGAAPVYRELANLGHAGFAFDPGTHAAAREFLIGHLTAPPDPVFADSFE
ncbi:MAG TPA: alpha/beta hydrolase [Xanthomonadales bacterium]|nr:alpha/beta hydrolase [Xanthomonadales bacterium]